MNWLKQLFCKHDYQPHIKQTKFQNLSGDRIYNICTKCGKHKGSEFRKHW